jgi:hypothetical protein
MSHVLLSASPGTNVCFLQRTPQNGRSASGQSVPFAPRSGTMMLARIGLALLTQCVPEARTAPDSACGAC